MRLKRLQKRQNPEISSCCSGQKRSSGLIIVAIGFCLYCNNISILVYSSWELQQSVVGDVDLNLSLSSSNNINNRVASSPGVAVASSKPLESSFPPSPMNFIPNNQLTLHDTFSDSFLLNKENFLKVPLDEIGIVEDACFAAVGKQKIHDHSKMFVDWTDFMVSCTCLVSESLICSNVLNVFFRIIYLQVEHMSKWWNEFQIMTDPDETMFKHILSIFRNYVEKVQKETPRQATPLQNTIAMIAFAPYKSKGNEGRGEHLTAHSLAATIASLYRVGFGRVVVTGYWPDDKTRVEEGFKLLGEIFNNQAGVVAAKIGNTELGYVHITDETWLKTKWVKFNMPRAAVIGMQKALGGKLGNPQQSKDWLGNHDASDWKFVYLTEPDTFLHTKKSLLSSLKHGLDRGLSFFPHRLQPLPHEINLPPPKHGDAYSYHFSSGYQSSYLPNVHPFSNITVLDDSTYCCDSGKVWPGRSKEFGVRQVSCGTWWWECGFTNPRKKIVDLPEGQVLEMNKRLVPYPMMTIRDGTGVVFGSTECGRRCFPSKTKCKQS